MSEPRETCKLEAPLREVWHVDSGAEVTGGRVFRREHNRLSLVDADVQRRVWTYPWTAYGAVRWRGNLLTWVDDELHVVDLETGRPRETLRCPHPVESVLDGDVLVGTAYADEGGHRLFAFDLGGRRRLWATHLHARVGSLAAGAGVVLCTQGEPQASLAFDIATGAQLWRGEGDYWLSAPTVHGNIAVGCLNRRVVGVALSDGRTLWQVEEGGPGCLHEGRYYSCWWGIYLVVDVRTGHRLQRWDLTARLPKTLRDKGLGQPILVSDTHVFIGSDRGFLFAFERDTGKYVWSHQARGAVAGGRLACASDRLFFSNGNRLSCFEPKRTA